VLAIADDLTGALEAGAKFACRGMAAAVSARLEFDGGDADVVVIDSETRHLAPAEAAAIVGGIASDRLVPLGRKLIYKKTDSTLRGNIRAELDALREALPGSRVAYVPAYPALGRTVKDGILLVEGVPLAETAFACDRLNPIRDSRVASVAGPGVEIFNGVTNADIGAAADRILAAPLFRVVAGPAAIAEALAERMGRAVQVRWPKAGCCLIVNGSRHPQSARQVRHAVERGTIGEKWRLFTEMPMGAVDPVEFAAEVGRRVRHELDRRLPAALMVFGGDTAFGILQALGLPTLFPIGEVLPGVPVSRVEGRPLYLITKAGGFGDLDEIDRIRVELS